MYHDTIHALPTDDTARSAGGSEPGVRVLRRSLLWMPAWAAAALIINPGALYASRGAPGSDTHATSADGWAINWEAFARSADADAKTLADGGSPQAYDAYLYALAMRAARLRLDSIPRAKLGAFGELDPKVSFGVGYKGAAFFVVEWSMEPHAYLPPHCHPNASVCTLGIAGEARVQHFETIDAPADFASRRTFRVRETRTDLISPGRVSTLSPTRDNIHTFRAGAGGARGVDISAMHGRNIGFSFLEIDNTPVDAELRLYGARWTGA